MTGPSGSRSSARRCPTAGGSTPRRRSSCTTRPRARALADAGLTKDDVDGFGSSGMGLLAPIEIAEYLGLRPTWVDGTGVGGATWEFMVEHAAAAIHGRPRRGRRARLRLDHPRRPQARRRTRQPRRSAPAGPVQFDAPYGHALIAKYAMADAPAHARVRHDHRAAGRDRGVDPLQRRRSTPTPTTATRSPSTTCSRRAMIADPLTKLHCCIRSDGGGAVVLTSRGAGADLRQGSRCGCSAPARRRRHTTMSEWADFTESPAVRSGPAGVRAGRRHARPTSTSARSTTRSRRWCC